MTRVDFYLLRSGEASARRLLACRLTEKAYRLGHRVYLYVDSDEEAHLMDDLLWTFRAVSFVPHEIASDGCAEPGAPVVLGRAAGVPGFDAVLINLSGDVPPNFQRYQRVGELLDVNGRAAGRQRFRLYKEAGCELHVHELDAAA